MKIQHLVNGQPGSDISILDRGLAYGQGVFETLLIAQGVICLLDAHLARLLSGCERLGIPASALETELRQDLSMLQLPATDAALKIVVTCGSGGRGYAIPEQPHLNRILILGPMPDYADQPHLGVRTRWCTTQVAVQPALSGIKHLNRLEQVLARREWNDPGIREGLVCDTRGCVIEGTMSNLFFVHEGTLHTPDLSGAGIDGIMRRQVMKAAQEQGVPVQTGDYCPEQILAASELFLTNSLIGIWPVTRLDDSLFPVGEMTLALQSMQLQRKV